jgi:hypothetical protein
MNDMHIFYVIYENNESLLKCTRTDVVIRKTMNNLYSRN